MNLFKIPLLVAIIGTCLAACQTKGKKNTDQNLAAPVKLASIEDGADSILVGRHTRKDLEVPPYDQWFTDNYKDYQADKKVIEDLKPLTEGVSIKIFMGTWCSDSQYHVPAFFKIMDQAGYSYSDFQIYSTKEDKTMPDQLEKKYNIINVPTFILYKDGKEMNRIVEYPLETIEKDLLDILQGKPYQNPYAE